MRLLHAFLTLSACLAFVLLSRSVSEPHRLSGPFNFDHRLLPSVALLLLLICCFLALWKWAQARLFPGIMASVAILIPTLVRFYYWPPIEDGAYLMLRFGEGYDQNHCPVGLVYYVYLLSLSVLAALWTLEPPSVLKSRAVLLVVARGVGAPLVAIASAYAMVQLAVLVMYELA